MNRSFVDWKKLGLRSLITLMLIGAISGLSACGSGGGGGDGDNTVNTTDTENANFIDFPGGSLTISGDDLGAGEGTPTLSRFFATPPGSSLTIRSWMTSSANLSIQVSFFTDGRLIVTIAFLDLGQETNRTYQCADGVATSCSGITHDPSAKTITFNDAVVPLPIASINNLATSPVTVNGTLKYPE